jgi:hypothetical protein
LCLFLFFGGGGDRGWYNYNWRSTLRSTRQPEANEVKGVSEEGKGFMDWMAFVVKQVFDGLNS